MSSGSVQITTVYNRADAPGRRSALRALALVSGVVAGVWLWAVLGPMEFKTTRWLLVAGMNEAISAMPPTVDTRSANPDPNDPAADGIITAEELREITSGSSRRLALLTTERYAWKGLGVLAGGWLALASLLGLAGRRIALRLHRQAAYLIILSALSSVAFIYGAIKWGGMPPNADAALYAKVFGVQSSYAWIILIATRLIRG